MGQALQVFTLAGVPVFINIWFVAVVGFLAYQAPGLGYSIAIASAWTVSILVHEFGHALVCLKYGLQPQILLHGIGGLCFHLPAPDDKKDILVTVAGAGLQIPFGVLLWVIQLGIAAAAPEVLLEDAGSYTRPTPIGYFFDTAILLSVVWGALNLIPLHPLDGGNLFRLLMRKRMRPVQAERLTHQVSIGVGIAAGAWGFSAGYSIAGIFAAFLVYANWEALSQLSMTHPISRKNVFADALLKDAEASFAAGDWHEAARMAHQVRDQANIGEKVQKRAFEIIVLSNVALKDWREAAGYVEHAPDNAAIREAKTAIERGLKEEGEEVW